MITVAAAISSLRPGAEWSMSDNDPRTLIWHTPGVETLSVEEIEAEVLRLQQAEQEISAAKEATRLSARARLADIGFTDAEIDVMYPALVASS